MIITRNTNYYREHSSMSVIVTDHMKNVSSCIAWNCFFVPLDTYLLFVKCHILERKWKCWQRDVFHVESVTL